MQICDIWKCLWSSCPISTTSKLWMHKYGHLNWLHPFSIRRKIVLDVHSLHDCKLVSQKNVIIAWTKTFAVPALDNHTSLQYYCQHPFHKDSTSSLADSWPHQPETHLLLPLLDSARRQPNLCEALYNQEEKEQAPGLLPTKIFKLQCLLYLAV